MPHPALHFSERLHAILVLNLLPLIMQQILVLGAYTLPVWARISRARQRITRLLANFAAGRLPRPHTPRPGRKGGPKPALYIPQSHAWLVAQIGYRAAGYGAQIDYLLREPATQALLATAPPEILKSLGRSLRPLCRLLGVEIPKPLLPSPRSGGAGGGCVSARPKPAKPKPQKPKLPPLLPLYPQRRPRPLPFMNFSKKTAPA